VTITHHPDVRRSLMTQKAYAEGLRALYLYTAVHQDPVSARVVGGVDSDLADRVNDLLLPIVKGVGSERAHQVLVESLQTLGGSGYLEDYPIEQYVRDAKIDSLYEGTTAIQAQDLIFRKIMRDGGATFGHVCAQIEDFAQQHDAFPRERELLAAALDDVQHMQRALLGYLERAQHDPTELYKIGLASVDFLLAVGDLLIGWRLLVQAVVAERSLDAGPSPTDRAFYEGKIATAVFFARRFLPPLRGTREVVDSIDGSLMALGEDRF
jgi:hypothetical protein